MASFKDKIKKNKTQQQGERVFFPKTLGIYTIPNPKVDRREYQPEVIGIPPVHRTSSVQFKGDTFQALQYWLGILYKEPIVVNVGTFPAEALYRGTEERMFPTIKNGFDKKIPMVGEEFGIDIPDTYDILSPVANEREKLLKKLKGANVSDKMKAFVTKELDKYATMDDAAMIRTTHDVRVTPRIYIPAVVADIQELEDLETGDIENTYIPTLAIFEQNLTISYSESLCKNKKVIDKYDPIEAADYLFSEAEGKVGEQILIFKNPLAMDDRTGNKALCIKEYNEKLNKVTTPLLDLKFDKEIDDKVLLRIIVLEMIGLYPTKEDKDSIEALLKTAIYNEIKAAKEDSN
jgi:hypothetical protein